MHYVHCDKFTVALHSSGKLGSIGVMQAPGRLASWLKSRHKVFRVDKEHVSLKPNFLRKYNPAEYGPPGFPTQDKSAAHAHAWSKRSAEDERILHLEEKILNWLAIKDKVTTTEMAEFAYATHEELVPGTQRGYGRALQNCIQAHSL